MYRTIFHIDADAFFASVEQGFNPLFRGKPVVVGGEAGRRGCVHTASYEARRKGVKTAMSTGKAEQICPGTIFLKGNFRQYRAAGKTMQKIYNSITPDVELASIDDAYLDLTGTRRLYPSVIETAGFIKQRIKEELNITVSIGIATSKLVARIASGLQKPDGIIEVKPGTEKQFLAPLPVRELVGIGHKGEHLLSELGIHTVGRLAAVPRRVVCQIFGNANGKKIWEYAQGTDTREVKEKEIPKQISRETSFEEDTSDEEIIMATLQYLTDRIAAKLRENQLVGRHYGLKIRYTSGGGSHKTMVIDPPSNDGYEMFINVKNIFRKISRPRTRVRNIGVTVSGLELTFRQGKLFHEVFKAGKLNESIDKARQAFGFTSLLNAGILPLKTKYKMDSYGFILHAPSLSQ